MKRIKICFLLIGALAYAQENDSLSINTTPTDTVQIEREIPPMDKAAQHIKISDTETYIYQKPKLWDVVNKLPRNFVNTAVNAV